MRVLGICKLPICLDGKVLCTPALVTPHVDDVIFGLVWLEERHIVWYAAEKEISFQGKRYKLTQQQNVNSCFRITASQTCVIPPHMQALIPIDLVRNPRDQVEKVLCFEAMALAR